MSGLLFEVVMDPKAWRQAILEILFTPDEQIQSFKQGAFSNTIDKQPKTHSLDPELF
ncbi:hypothetical protein [Segetibacter sp. 3557_3]|uniref:hypothetical protein n=1 Tax=Segetibacter sp. 3557_3 TaxID=2547429 RepID=UPI001404F36A|nr:hypothetical protein [Segetibacter sp. 3557_3]